jgi:hypothetical protein
LAVAVPVLETVPDGEGDEEEDPDRDADTDAVPVLDPEALADTEGERVELLDERGVRDPDEVLEEDVVREARAEKVQVLVDSAEAVELRVDLEDPDATPEVEGEDVLVREGDADLEPLELGVPLRETDELRVATLLGEPVP